MFAAFLSGWTFVRAIRAKNAAVAWLGSQFGVARCTFIEKLAEIGWHDFVLLESTLRAGDSRLQDWYDMHFIHSKANHFSGPVLFTLELSFTRIYPVSYFKFSHSCPTETHRSTLGPPAQTQGIGDHRQ